MPMAALAQAQRMAESSGKGIHVYAYMCGVLTCTDSDAAATGLSPLGHGMNSYHEIVYQVLKLNTIITQAATDVLNVVLNIDAIFIRPK